MIFLTKILNRISYHFLDLFGFEVAQNLWFNLFKFSRGSWFLLVDLNDVISN